MVSIYDFQVTKNDGQLCAINRFAGQVLLIVNTASHCGFTKQYSGLEELQKRFHKQGFNVLAFPCNQFANQEPGDNKTIRNFCDLQFNISFPLFSKIKVNGAQADPLFNYLKHSLPGLLGSEKIKWNFTKFLVNKKGQPCRRYSPFTAPENIAKDIAALLAE